MTSEIVIREAKKEELKLIKKLSVDELPSELTEKELRNVEGAKEAFGKRMDAIMARGGNEFYVAESGEGIAGYVWFGDSQRPFSGEKVGWIYDIQVLPEHRGKGIGEALMRHAMKVSKERGFDEIGLMVNTKNRVAWTLYEKLGFDTEYRIMGKKEGKPFSDINASHVHGRVSVLPDASPVHERNYFTLTKLVSRFYHKIIYDAIPYPRVWGVGMMGNIASHGFLLASGRIRRWSGDLNPSSPRARGTTLIRGRGLGPTTRLQH